MGSLGDIQKNGFRFYKNSCEVGALGGISITVTDVILASLFAKLNILLVSDPGYGKTQLANDILHGLYGGKGLFFRGSQEINLESVLMTLDLNALKNVSDPREAVKLTEAINYPIFYVDEIKRCPELIQNIFFSLFDGYLEHPFRAEQLKLGGDYHVGIASANSIDPSTSYSGEFSIDDALLERMHVVLNLKHYSRTVSDLYEADMATVNDPRIKFAEDVDFSKKIMEIHNELINENYNLNELLFKAYLEFGLDYLPGNEFKETDNSKRILDDDFPQVVMDTGNTQNKIDLIKPFSPRTTNSVISLARGLRKIIALKGEEPDELESLQLALEIILPYSGRLTEPLFNISKRKNRIVLSKPILIELMDDFNSRVKKHERCIAASADGRLTSDDLMEFKGKTTFLKNIAKKIDNKRKRELVNKRRVA